MATLHEALFDRLQRRAEISALIGQTEDLHLDCKTWPASDADAQRILAKAFAGFANADGGVVVIGLETKPAVKGDPDLITGEKPVASSVAIKSRIEALVGELVEPPLQGVRLATVENAPRSADGFVLIHVPPTDGTPVRSRKNSHFYVRSGSGTYPMEYFQIADMFGRRRRPALELSLEVQPGAANGARGVIDVVRAMMLGLRNEGRGLARFPSVRVRADGPLFVDIYGADGNGTFGLNRLLADANVIAFGGGVDHVIHPGTTLKIAKLVQRGRLTSSQPDPSRKTYVFAAINITVEMFADEVQSKTETRALPEEEFAL
jgi:hypothetical protein